MALMLADTHAGMAAVLGVFGVMDLVVMFVFEPWFNTAFQKKPE